MGKTAVMVHLLIKLITLINEYFRSKSLCFLTCYSVILANIILTSYVGGPNYTIVGF